MPAVGLINDCCRGGQSSSYDRYGHVAFAASRALIYLGKGKARYRKLAENLDVVLGFYHLFLDLPQGNYNFLRGDLRYARWLLGEKAWARFKEPRDSKGAVDRINRKTRRIYEHLNDLKTDLDFRQSSSKPRLRVYRYILHLTYDLTTYGFR